MRLVITGAAGLIGNEVVQELSDSHELCLVDCKPISGRASIVADLALHDATVQLNGWVGARPLRWTDAFKGAEVVVHLAEESHPQTTSQRVLHNNMQATWNVLQASLEHGVRRVVYASSNWVVKSIEWELAPECYQPRGPKIASEAPPRPSTYYGIGKACGEITGRMLVDERKLGSFVAVRIGWYHPSPQNTEEYRILGVGVQDLRTLFRRCIETEFEGFHVVYGVSAQQSAPYNLSHTRRLLSWEPQQLP